VRIELRRATWKDVQVGLSDSDVKAAKLCTIDLLKKYLGRKAGYSLSVATASSSQKPSWRLRYRVGHGESLAAVSVVADVAEAGGSISRGAGGGVVAIV
jgi:hypothetical protein